MTKKTSHTKFISNQWKTTISQKVHYCFLPEKSGQKSDLYSLKNNSNLYQSSLKISSSVKSLNFDAKTANPFYSRVQIFFIATQIWSFETWRPPHLFICAKIRFTHYRDVDFATCFCWWAHIKFEPENGYLEFWHYCKEPLTINFQPWCLTFDRLKLGTVMFNTISN